MTTSNPGFIAQIKSFPSSFWVANTMEIFERMAWYGFFALSSLYITGATETGGLGFTSEQRGAIQAIIPFILYLLPVLTGALADRYGFKRMFLISYVCMVVFYYALGQFKTLPSFLMAFFFVAIAAAIFKPVVVGTVARTTKESNSRVGFGVFYMMVNVGGFLGPVVAGLVRAVSWEWVFIASSGWALINLVICTFFYREPPKPADWKPRTLAQVGRSVYEVLGNLRFFLTAFVIIVAMMIAQFGPWWFKWYPHAAIFIPLWLIANLVWNAVLPKGSGPGAGGGGDGVPWYRQRVHCSDWRFALFLLILSGFWTSFNQIFLTMPEYIRDFTQTSGLVNIGRSIGGDGLAKRLAAVEEREFLSEVDRVLRQARGVSKLDFDVPGEASPQKQAKENREKLDTLRKTAGELAGSAHLSAADRARAATLRDALNAVSRDDPAAVAAALETHKGAVEALEDEARFAMYQGYPGVTPEVIARLGELAGLLNDVEAKEPVRVVDLMESARTVLGYKVRFAPVDYAEVLARVPLDPRTPSDAALDAAVTLLNRRLWEFRQAEYQGEEEQAVRATLREMAEARGALVEPAELDALAKKLTKRERVVKPEFLASAWRVVAYADALSPHMDRARQFNPEFIINLNALGIVLFQVLVSFLIARFHQFTGMIIGMVVAAVGIGLPALAGDMGFFGPGGIGLIVCGAILTFSFGEMMASPTSQEYVGRIAPPERVALYMGYYFVAVALGNLFGGILSGNFYGWLARDLQRPDLMWLAFGLIMLATALVFLLYNRFALPKQPKTASPAHV